MTDSLWALYYDYFGFQQEFDKRVNLKDICRVEFYKYNIPCCQQRDFVTLLFMKTDYIFQNQCSELKLLKVKIYAYSQDLIRNLKLQSNPVNNADTKTGKPVRPIEWPSSFKFLQGSITGSSQVIHGNLIKFTPLKFYLYDLVNV